MAEKEVGNLKATVSLTTAEFNKGIAAMSKQMAIMTQDFKNASAGLDKVGDASKLSALKITELTGKIEGQKKIVQQFAEAHKYAAERFGEGSKQALDYELKLKKAEGTLQSMERQLASTTAQLKIQESEWTALGKKMSDMSAKCKEIGSKMTDVGKNLSMAVTAPIVAAGVAAGKLASDLSENLNKTDVAFKENANEVKGWSGTTLKSFGIAKGSALEMASLFGDMASGMDINTKTASEMSMNLVGLAGDLASFKNIGLDQASDALKGIFTGEGESLKSLGVIMLDSTLAAFALETGQKKLYKDMDQGEKVMLRYQYVLDKTKNSQGDFARTSEGTANQTRIFGETMKELGANIGQYILPAVTPLIAKLSEMAQKFGDMSPAVQKITLVTAAIAAAIGPVIVAVGSLIFAFSAISGAIGAASGAIAGAGGIIAVFTGPVGWAVAAVAALVAGGVLLYKNWDTVKAKGQEMLQALAPVWEGIKAAVQGAWEYIGPTLIAGVAEISAYWNEVWPQIQQVFQAVWGVIGTIVKPILEAMYVVISAGVGFITGFWKDAWNIIKDELKLAWDLIVDVLRLAWDVISGIFKVALDLLTGNWSKAWADFKQIFVDAWDDLKGLFSDLATNAVQWGKDMIQGLIDGIMGMIDGVKNAVSDVAGVIAEYLHFSTPDVGPLVEYEKWMPDFMSGLAKGIQNSKLLVTDALGDLTADMNLNLNTNALSPAMAGTGPMTSQTITNINNQQTMNIDYEKLGSAVAKALSAVDLSAKMVLGNRELTNLNRGLQSTRQAEATRRGGQI